MEAVIVVVDGGGRHLMGVDGDLGGVGQLAAGQPAHPNAARVGPPGEAPGPLPTQRLAKVIKGWWTEVLGVGQDLLPSIQIRPGAGDQLRDLLQLACVPLLDGLLGVGGWSFEVLQVPGHEREHARSPTPAAGWWLPKALHPAKPIGSSRPSQRVWANCRCDADPGVELAASTSAGKSSAANGPFPATTAIAHWL